MKKKISGFSIFIIIYVTVWMAVTAGLCIYVWSVLKKYQSSYDNAVQAATDTVFMDKWVKEISEDDLKTFIDESQVTFSPYENDAVDKVFGTAFSYVKDGKVTYKKAEEYKDNKPVYELFAGDEPFAKITLKHGVADQYGISGWEFDKSYIKSYLPKTSSYEYIVRSDDNILVNGKELLASDVIREDAYNDEMYDAAAEFTNAKYTKKYIKISGLYSEPEITFTAGDGTEVLSEKTKNADDYTRHIKEGFEDEASRIALDGIMAYARYNNLVIKYDDYKRTLLDGSVLLDIVVANRKNIEWNDEVRELTATESKVTDIIRYSDKCFTASVYVKLNKRYNYLTTTEEISYRCLYVNVNGKWYLSNLTVE